MSERKIIDYCIIQYNDYSRLSCAVANAIIDEGWQPYGFPAFPNEEGPYVLYTQALVKYDNG